MKRMLFKKYLVSSISYLVFLLLILNTLYSTLNTVVFAQTATATPNLNPTTVDQKDAIQDLKEKVANKVAEIRKKNNKAVAGRVTSVSDNSLKVKTLDQNEFDVKLQTSGLTKYYQISGNQQKEIDKDNVEKDDYIIITGVIADKSVTANSVFIDQQYFSGNGKISEVDSDNFTIKVIASDKTVYSLNIETSTKQQIVNIKTLELERIGFSKIKEGDSIHFVVKVSGGEKNNVFSAEKILIIPQEYFMK